METFLWFIHDSRGNVQRAILEKEKEYKEHQKKVLRESRIKHGGGSNDPELTSTSESPLKSDFDDASHDLDLRAEGSTKFFTGRNEEVVGNKMLEPEPEPNKMDDEDMLDYERRLKMKNRKEYFNSLDDILE